MAPFADSTNSPAKATAPRKSSFMGKVFGGRKKSKEVAVEAKEVTPVVATPTYYAVVHTFLEGKAEGFFKMISSMGEADMAAMAAKHHALGFHNHSFMPTGGDKVLCVWECKEDTPVEAFQAFVDGPDGPAPGVFVNECRKVMPGAVAPTSFFHAPAAAPAAAAPTTGTFFWVYHSFKEGAAPAFWSMIQGMKPEDFASMADGHHKLGLHNHSFLPCATDGKHAAICIWESQSPMTAEAFQAFIDGPDGPGAGKTFENEVYVAAPGAATPSAHFAKYEPGFQYVKLEFEILADKLEAFQEGLRGPLGIPFTIKQPGFQFFLPCVHKEKNADGNYTVTFFAQWTSCDAWKAYMATPERAADSELMQALGPCLGPKGFAPTFADALDLGPEAHVFKVAAGEQFEYAKLEFEILGDKLAQFQEGLKAPLGLPFTAEQKGFKAVFSAVAQEKNAAGNYLVTFFAMWDSMADHQAYMGAKERAPDSETMQVLLPCLGPNGLDVTYADPLDLGTPHGFLPPPTPQAETSVLVCPPCNTAPDKVFGEAGAQAMMWLNKLPDGKQVARLQIQKGFDWRKSIKPVLPGCPDWCPATHFGYLESGSMGIRMKDGSERTIKAGETYLVLPGHLPIMSEDAVMVEFSQDTTYTKDIKK